MVSSILKIGDKLDIRVLQQVEASEKSGESPRVFKSIIYDIKSNGDLEIAMPTEGGKMVLLALGLRYELVFYAKNGMYRCIGQVKERYKSDNLYMVSMELKTNLSKFQRREYYRLECLIDMEFLPITEEEAKLSGAELMLEHHKAAFPKDSFRKGIAVDISGGGMRFVSKEELEDPANALVKMHLANEVLDREILVPGAILQMKRVEKETKKFEYRVKFSIKDNRIREQIIKYIFEEERKSRKNEKG